MQDAQVTKSLLLKRLTRPRFGLYVDSSGVSFFDVDSMITNPGMLREQASTLYIVVGNRSNNGSPKRLEEPPRRVPRRLLKPLPVGCSAASGNGSRKLCMKPALVLS